MDRLTGEISVPARNLLFWKKNRNFKFDDSVISSKCDSLGQISIINMRYGEKADRMSYIYKFSIGFQPEYEQPEYAMEVVNSYSLIVWFMDKNRELPPGTAFDPYREEDYERRKSEGFLDPLYKSNNSFTS